MESKNKQNNKPLAAGARLGNLFTRIIHITFSTGKRWVVEECKVKGLNNWFTIDPWQCLDIYKLIIMFFQLSLNGLKLSPEWIIK
ncbi:hypothetical protein [Leptospira mayottensis]|uniref:hypothetical protein n=1 Tax=Leptospira mayottensis TaxID=1137606 RepID=UPI0020B10BBD|nr:hypothetical protein [Leptospira mayottensis]